MDDRRQTYGNFEANGAFHRAAAATFFLLAMVFLFGPAQPVAAADYTEALAAHRTGDYEQCIAVLDEILTSGFSGESYRLLKIDAELKIGRYADALATLDAALERFPDSVQLRWIGRDVVRLNDHAERVDAFDAEIVTLAQRNTWRYSDAANKVMMGRFLLAHGEDAKQVLDLLYNDVKKFQPSFVEAHLASGDLALEKFDYALAAQSYEQAVKLDPENPDALFGVAQSYAPSDNEKAEAALEAALTINPRHLPSLLMLVDTHLDAERYDNADEVLSQIRQINPKHPIAAAYRSALAHLRADDKKERQYRAAALRPWPTNPEVDYLIGKQLSQHYRFAEGARHQRLALAFDKDYLPAKMQLAQDLLRLGEEDEGWALAEQVYREDGYSVFAHNLVTLQEELSKFRTLEQDGLFVRMDPREADIYGDRVVQLLTQAKRELCAKYDVELPRMIVIELFPKQEDFAIRTFGMPGGAGFLGVCFGTVITANSPASQGAHPSCWEATLWHEFCHVVTLSKTHNKMPRWLSEGISVYEERCADPVWGQSMTPTYREMVLGDDLTPVSELSSAFLNPASSLHLQFAYYESSLVVQYLVETYGHDMLNRVLVDLGAGMPINESLARYTGALTALDEEFAAYARAQAKDLAPGADWSPPELPRRADAETIAAWLKEHPKNYAAIKQLAKQQISAKNWAEAKATLLEARSLYPNDAEADSPYLLLAEVHRQLNEPQQELAALQAFAERSADNTAIFERLSTITSAQQDWDSTRDYAQRWLAVNPLQPAPHRVAALAAERLRDDHFAIGSQRALLLLDPFDPAELHYRLGLLLQRSGDLADARRHALLALEEAPRYRDAHTLLLTVHEQSNAAAEQTVAQTANSTPAGIDSKEPDAGIPAYRALPALIDIELPSSVQEESP